MASGGPTCAALQRQLELTIFTHALQGALRILTHALPFVCVRSSLLSIGKKKKKRGTLVYCKQSTFIKDSVRRQRLTVRFLLAGVLLGLLPPVPRWIIVPASLAFRLLLLLFVLCFVPHLVVLRFLDLRIARACRLLSW